MADLTDRELLEAAAKAAKNGANSYSQGCLWISTGPYPNTYARWDPLANDGDALRLAVKLRILIEPCKTMQGKFVEVHAYPSGRGDCAGIEPLGAGNDEAATRRAIVRAAAALATA